MVIEYKYLRTKSYIKAFGQNFLQDESILKRIVDSTSPVEKEVQSIIEIGSGPCTLTRLLFENFRSEIICIEKDERFKEKTNQLSATCENKISFLHQDAVNTNISELTNNRIVVVSNLPYSASVPILFNLFSHIQKIDKMILMFQKEVAERICAKTNTKSYGRLSIASQLLCDTRILFNIPNTAFRPIPKVESALVEFVPLPHVNHELLSKIMKLDQLCSYCFQQRRKIILNILKKRFPQEKIEIELEKIGIDVLSRPENIPPVKFLELSEALIS
jgi:16S rRNA (adenine1518-N6/adenine1519-N6)-dimethyltransferase